MIPARGLPGYIVSFLVAIGGCHGSKAEPADGSSPLTAADDGRAPASSGQEPTSRPRAWADWPMPNSPASGLPNPQSYDTSMAGVVVDRVTGLMWQRRLDGSNATLVEAQARCRASALAGYGDWRLPSRIELVSIIDSSRTQPSIDSAAFPGTPSDWFWTGSIAANVPTAAWYVYFYFGYPKTDDVNNRFSVRCVRGGPPPLAGARYEIQSDVVRDVATGLTWERTIPSQTFGFEAARMYCGHLMAGGQGGFRLPSLAELSTLVDEHAANPTIDATAFPGTPGESFWTSSLFADSPAMAWHVYFDHGSALYGLLAATYWVRCVR